MAAFVVVPETDLANDNSGQVVTIINADTSSALISRGKLPASSESEFVANDNTGNLVAIINADTSAAVIANGRVQGLVNLGTSAFTGYPLHAADINYDATLTADGNALGLNLAHSNTWTVEQFMGANLTFANGNGIAATGTGGAVADVLYLDSSNVLQVGYASWQAVFAASNNVFNALVTANAGVFNGLPDLSQGTPISGPGYNILNSYDPVDRYPQGESFFGTIGTGNSGFGADYGTVRTMRDYGDNQGNGTVGFPFQVVVTRNAGTQYRRVLSTSKPVWAASTAYALDAYVMPTQVNQNGWYFQATVAGTSGTTEPTWPNTSGGTVVDGTVTWEAVGQFWGPWWNVGVGGYDTNWQVPQTFAAPAQTSPGGIALSGPGGGFAVPAYLTNAFFLLGQYGPPWTASLMTVNSGASAWVERMRFGGNAAQGAAGITFYEPITAGGGITGTGNTGTLTAGTGILGTNNVWNAPQTFTTITTDGISGYASPGTSSADNNYWCNFATVTITQQYTGASGYIQCFGYGIGATLAQRANIWWRAYQQAAMGSAPYVELCVLDQFGVALSNVVSITTTNSAAETVCELWVQLTQWYESWDYTPILWQENGGATTSWAASALVAALPAGTQTAAIWPSPTYANLTAEGAATFSSGTVSGTWTVGGQLTTAAGLSWSGGTLTTAGGSLAGWAQITVPTSGYGLVPWNSADGSYAPLYVGDVTAAAGTFGSLLTAAAGFSSSGAGTFAPQATATSSSVGNGQPVYLQVSDWNGTAAVTQQFELRAGASPVTSTTLDMLRLYDNAGNVLMAWEYGGAVSTKNNTLDDGSGNMTIAGLATLNATTVTNAGIGTSQGLGDVGRAIVVGGNLNGATSFSNNQPFIGWNLSGGSAELDVVAQAYTTTGANTALQVRTLTGTASPYGVSGVLFGVGRDGQVNTANNTLDDGSGNMTPGGNLTITSGKNLYLSGASGDTQLTQSGSGVTVQGIEATLLSAQISGSPAVFALDTSGDLGISGALYAASVSASTLKSTAPAGTAPLSVASTTQVANLNASMVGGWGIGSLSAALTSTTAGTTAGDVFITSFFLANSSGYPAIQVVYLNNYENDTATDQTVSWPKTFANYAYVVANSTGLAISASTTGLTITTPDSTSPLSGMIMVIGA